MELLKCSGFYGIFEIFPDDLPKPSKLRDKEHSSSELFNQAKLSSQQAQHPAP